MNITLIIVLLIIFIPGIVAIGYGIVSAIAKLVDGLGAENEDKHDS